MNEVIYFSTEMNTICIRYYRYLSNWMNSQTGFDNKKYNGQFKCYSSLVVTNAAETWDVQTYWSKQIISRIHELVAKTGLQMYRFEKTVYERFVLSKSWQIQNQMGLLWKMIDCQGYFILCMLSFFIEVYASVISRFMQ